MDTSEFPPSDSDSHSESEEDCEEEEEEEEDHMVNLRMSIIPPGYWGTVAERLSSYRGRPYDIGFEGSSSQRKNREVDDGSCCPICYESWTSGGDHHVCCLPCGHIYGLSCIKKWFAASQGLSECPKCEKRCALWDIRLLYTTQIGAVDQELQKKVQSLEAECVSLQKKKDDWSEKEAQWKEKEADLCKKVRYLEERTHNLEDLLEDSESRASGSYGQKNGDTVAKTKDERMNLEGNREVDDGSSCCPICHESWSSGGDHHVCCLPCGHVYGLSCIKKWLRRRGSSKCPQCKNKCALKDIRRLYATQIVAVDGELQKKVQSLEAECVSLQIENDDWYEKEVQWKAKEADLCKKVRYLEERTHRDHMDRKMKDLKA